MDKINRCWPIKSIDKLYCVVFHYWSHEQNTRISEYGNVFRVTQQFVFWFSVCAANTAVTCVLVAVAISPRQTGKCIGKCTLSLYIRSINVFALKNISKPRGRFQFWNVYVLAGHCEDFVSQVHHIYGFTIFYIRCA